MKDKEICTADIEEEDWIEYVMRSADEAMKRMETARITCWIETQEKNEMETSDENSISTRRKMGKESSRMEP